MCKRTDKKLIQPRENKEIIISDHELSLKLFMVMTISVSIDANIIVRSITQESQDVVLKSINRACHYPSLQNINFLYYRLLIVCMSDMITFMIWLKCRI